MKKTIFTSEAIAISNEKETIFTSVAIAIAKKTEKRTEGKDIKRRC